MLASPRIGPSATRGRDQTSAATADAAVISSAHSDDPPLRRRQPNRLSDAGQHPVEVPLLSVPRPAPPGAAGKPLPPCFTRRKVQTTGSIGPSARIARRI